MKVLIIGGTGLISTPLTRQLLERGDEVTLYNRGQTEARLPPGATTIRGDRTDYPAFEARLRAGPRYDCVIDMICFRPAEAESLLRAVRGRTAHLLASPPGAAQPVRPGQGPLRGGPAGGPPAGRRPRDHPPPGPDLRRGAGLHPRL